MKPQTMPTQTPSHRKAVSLSPFEIPAYSHICAWAERAFDTLSKLLTVPSPWLTFMRCCLCARTNVKSEHIHTHTRTYPAFLRDNRYHPFHFTVKETEAQKCLSNLSKVTQPKRWTQAVQFQRPNSQTPIFYLPEFHLFELKLLLLTDVSVTIPSETAFSPFWIPTTYDWTIHLALTPT